MNGPEGSKDGAKIDQATSSSTLSSECDSPHDPLPPLMISLAREKGSLMWEPLCFLPSSFCLPCGLVLSVHENKRIACPQSEKSMTTKYPLLG